MANPDTGKDRLSKAEADSRRDELVRRILRTPPEPRKPLGKSRQKPTGKRKPAK